MSRYIDADVLIAELQKDEECFDKEAECTKDDPSYTEGYSDAMWSRANGIRDAMIEIYDAPSIDIVRCKDCKHWLNHKYADCDQNDFVYYCAVHKVSFSGKDFCSYGEREGK